MNERKLQQSQIKAYVKEFFGFDPFDLPDSESLLRSIENDLPISLGSLEEDGLNEENVTSVLMTSLEQLVFSFALENTVLSYTHMVNTLACIVAALRFGISPMEIDAIVKTYFSNWSTLQ